MKRVLNINGFTKSLKEAEFKRLEKLLEGLKKEAQEELYDIQHKLSLRDALTLYNDGYRTVYYMDILKADIALSEEMGPHRSAREIAQLVLKYERGKRALEEAEEASNSDLNQMILLAELVLRGHSSDITEEDLECYERLAGRYSYARRLLNFILSVSREID